MKSIKSIIKLFFLMVTITNCSPTLNRNYLEIISILSSSFSDSSSNTNTSTNSSTSSGTFQVTANVSNVIGSNMIISLNGSEFLNVTASGSFTFGTNLTSGSSYTILIPTQPSSPSQTCTPISTSGTITQNTTINIDCGVAAASPGFTYGTPSSLIVSESGTTLTFTVALSSQPNGTVIFNTGSTNPAESSVSPTTLNFDSTNWNISQTITVTGVADGAADTNKNFQVILSSITGTDTTGYQALSNQNVPYIFTNTDINTTYTAGGTITGLLGGDSVNIGLSTTSCGNHSSSTGSNGTYTFGASLVNGCTYTAAINSHPTGKYCIISNNSGVINSGNVTNINLNCIKGVVASNTSVREGGTVIYNVQLNSDPLSSVTIGISSNISSSIGFSPNSFNLDSTNWNTGVNVTISGLTDANIIHEIGTIKIAIGSNEIGTSSINVWDADVSNSRFIFVTTNTHDGNFAGDGSLTGINSIKKSDSFCKNNIPAGLAGTGSYRSLLVGTTRDQSTDWSIRPNLNYYNSSFLQVGSSDASSVLTLTTSIGTSKVWTGMSGFGLLGTDCSNWGSSLVIATGGVGDGTSTAQAFSDGSTPTCNNTFPIYCAQNAIDLKDGTVAINSSNIRIQKCPSGVSYDANFGTCVGSSSIAFCSGSNPTCDGTIASDSPAKTVCDNLNSSSFGGRNTWRLPTVPEATSIGLSWKDDSTLFGGNNSTDFWTSNTVTTTNANSFNSNSTSLNSTVKTNSIQLFCVSSGI